MLFILFISLWFAYLKWVEFREWKKETAEHMKDVVRPWEIEITSRGSVIRHLGREKPHDW